MVSIAKYGVLSEVILLKSCKRVAAILSVLLVFALAPGLAVANERERFGRTLDPI